MYGDEFVSVTPHFYASCRVEEFYKVGIANVDTVAQSQSEKTIADFFHQYRYTATCSPTSAYLYGETVKSEKTSEILCCSAIPSILLLLVGYTQGYANMNTPY